MKRTIHEWNSLGYVVKKGSKHVSRNKKGECLFSSKQVFLSTQDGDLEYDSCWEYEWITEYDLAVNGWD